jgi:deoxyribodipyrimidine photo-lyase
MKTIDERIEKLKSGAIKKGVICYWMSRDQRADDNWALYYAQKMALETKSPLVVVFCLVPDFLGATLRQYDFMLKSLEEVENSLLQKNIPFYLLQGRPEREILKFIKQADISFLVTDFDPLKIKRRWKVEIAQKIKIPFYEIDAHNIVPCRVASNKQEYGAHTIRSKIKRLLPEYLTEIAQIKRHSYNKSFAKRTDWGKIYRNLKVDKSVNPVKWLLPGEAEAKKVLYKFIKEKLKNYPLHRNDPNKKGISNLSPYLHFGQIFAQRVALEVKKSNAPKTAKEAFLEELVVRRELSDNFCLYNSNYDSSQGFPNWALKTLKAHLKDKREYLYSPANLENAKTHDPLWNTAQKEMVLHGKMHGFLRMYWCKKILQWTKDYKTALRISIYLNDKYELDGRDPNGYTGIMWAIGGVHDRPWGGRKVFGNIRYMSYDGCRKKFDVDKYISDFS